MTQETVDSITGEGLLLDLQTATFSVYSHHGGESWGCGLFLFL